MKIQKCNKTQLAHPVGHLLSLKNTPLLYIRSKRRKKNKKHHHTPRVIFPKIFVSARYSIQSYPRQCSNLRRNFSRHRYRNRQIKHARCFFNELKFVSRDSDLFRRLLSNEFSLAFSSFFPTTSPLRLRAPPRGLSKRLLPREKERERENSITPISCPM